MCKYKKVNNMEVLKKYHEILCEWRRNGCWQDFISIEEMARFLKTSKYQIQKAYKSLKEKEYIKLEQVPTDWEEYYNGLYDVSVPVLFTKVYVITRKGIEKAKELGGNK